MHALDWWFIAIPLLLVVGIGLYTRRYMRSVAHFLSSGRLAGRYLLAVATGEMQAGAVVFVASFEQIAKSGFTLTWWRWIPVPVFFIAAISGFVIYRFRETRALTLAQFFEIRYSKRFRLFTGTLAFFAGVMNFGIIPAVGARVFVYFFGLPETLMLAGFALPTYIPLMAALLSITLTLTLAGGLITVMVTDCVEGILSQLCYVVIITALLITFRWSDISETLAARPAGQSLLNPFDSLAIQDFNLGYVLMGMVITLYGTMAWQNASAYNAAAYTPHELRMGSVLGRLRELGKISVTTLLAVCALTYLQHPHYAAASAEAAQVVQGIQDINVRQQMEIPVALAHFLPIGVKGLLCAIFLMGVFGGDTSHLHSWGGILVQDVLVPLRKKPFPPEQHIRVLRLAIIGVAAFAFLFGCVVRQTEYIFMWWAATMAIYTGGAGAVIIGGLYWRKGTTAGAWAALLTGSVLSLGGIIARQIYRSDFPLNGIQISFSAMLSAVTVYVAVSLLTHRRDFNLDRMLHRGEYAALKPLVGDPELVPPTAKPPSLWGRMIGFDETFTRGDRWIAGGLFAWSMVWIVVLVAGSLGQLLAPWSLETWSVFWHVVGILIPVTITVLTGVWFTWGGLKDMRELFRRLAVAQVRPLDNGMVVDHMNLEEHPQAAPPADGSSSDRRPTG